MEEVFDYTWIIPVLGFVFFFVLPIVKAVRKALKDQETKFAADVKRLQAEQLQQFQKLQRLKSSPKPAKQPLTADQRRNLDRQRDMARAKKHSDPQSQVESGVSEVEGQGLLHAFEGGTVERLPSTSRAGALTADLSEGRSLLVDIAQAQIDDFSDAKLAQKASLLTDLRQPKNLRMAILAAEIMKRPS